MQIFIDSANIGEIAQWFKMGVIDGVTADKLPALLAELDAAGAPGSPGC